MFHGQVVRLCFAAVMLLFFSCQKKETTPEGILSNDQMVNVLSELYVIEQKISTLGVKRDSLNQIFDEMKSRVFEKTGVTDSVFRRSLNYYMDHPQTLEVVYTSLIDSLNLREQRMLSSEVKK